MLGRRPAVISNEIRLKRSQHPGSFLVVEGRDDRLFCERYTDASCNLVVGEGKESVQNVIRILDEARFAGVVGLVDSDFDLLEGTLSASANLVATDVHDLEVALLRSPALDRVIIEFGIRSKIEAAGNDVRKLLIEAATPVGYLRWLSRREGLGLRFRGLNVGACIDPSTLEPDPRAIIREVKNLSQRPDLDDRDLERGVNELSGAGHDIWQVCCGEDLVSVLSFGFRKAIGSNSAEQVQPAVLRRSLRLAVDEGDFRRLSLNRSLREWEARNPNFRVLR